MITASPTHRIEIFPGGSKEQGKLWFFRIRRIQNGQTVAMSEGYHNRADCRRTAMELRAGLGWAEIFGTDQ